MGAILNNVSADTIFWASIIFMSMCNIHIGGRIIIGVGSNGDANWDSKEHVLWSVVVMAVTARVFWAHFSSCTPDPGDRFNTCTAHGAKILHDIHGPAVVFSMALIVTVHLSVLIFAMIKNRK